MIIDPDGIKEVCYVKEFISKRNNVSLYELTDKEKKKQHVVIKKFENEDAYKNELSIYQRLSGHYDEAELLLNFPKLLGYDDSKLLLALSYIKGDHVLELLEYYERINFIEQSSQILIEVLEWLNQFYTAIGITGDEVFGDVNLRNFIITDDGVFGVDFENVKSGERKSEIMEVLAFYMLYDPIKSDVKKSVVGLVRKKYLEHKMQNQDIGKFSTLLGEEIKRIQMRRNC